MNQKRKWRKVIAIAAVAAMFMIAAGAYALFHEELKIAGSIHLLEGRDDVYYMEVEGDYHFEEFLKSGGASSDGGVSAFLTERISKGFYKMDVTNKGPKCSVLSARDAKGGHVWGRNFDWDGSVPIIVKCIPKNGYASISTCDFKNITNDPQEAPDVFWNKMLAIAAVYVPMDGINEKGLCVADLEVNEGGMKEADTQKPDLTVTTAIRLLLNRAATVDEAVNLLKQYDIHASAGISHHLAISDASGESVSVEFVDGEMVSVDTDCVTNFNLANGDLAAGGASAKERYERLLDIQEKNKGRLSSEQLRDAMMQVSKSKGEWRTQWTIVYQQDTQMAEYFFGGVYEDGVSFSILSKSKS